MGGRGGGGTQAPRIARWVLWEKKEALIFSAHPEIAEKISPKPVWGGPCLERGGGEKKILAVFLRAAGAGK